MTTTTRAGYPAVHVSRLTSLHREAQRKGCSMSQAADESWQLKDVATGATLLAPALTLDDIAAYLHARSFRP